jgi:spore germination protein YaaH
MTAWVPSWDSNATTILERQAGNLAESNPGWYYAAADGSVTLSPSGINSRLRSALSGTELMPTIKNYVNGGFDGDMMATLLASPALREKHAETIAQLVVTNAYDGIDIDYEDMPATAKSNFTAFVSLLASKLHANGKKLSVTVSPKTTGTETWSGPGAQDWPAIGAAADSVKIMAYDYHWSTSSAGPIAPLAWLGEVAKYAGRTLPAGKAIIGLPWYGYDWLSNRGSGVTYAQAMTQAQLAGAAISRDENGELTYAYSGRTVFFQDATSYRRKVDAVLAANSGVGGFAHWRVGAEDPATWDVMSALQGGGGGGGSTPSEPALKDFTIIGPNAMSVDAGRESSASFAYTGINGFDESVVVTAQQLDAFPGTFALSQNTIPANGAATLTVWPSRKAAAGTYRLSVTMQGGGLRHAQVISVTVSAPATIKRRAVR